MRRCVLSRSCVTYIQCKVNANRLRCQGSHRWQKGSSFAPLDPPWIRHCWMSCLYIHDTVPYGLMHRAYIISLTKMFTHTVLYISLFFNRIIPLRIMANWICHDIHLQFWTSQSCSWGGISSRGGYIPEIWRVERSVPAQAGPSHWAWSNADSGGGIQWMHQENGDLEKNEVFFCVNWHTCKTLMQSWRFHSM